VANPEVLNGRIRFDVDSDHLGNVMAHLSGLGIRSLVSHPPTLEELFLRHYGDQIHHEESEEASTTKAARR
jgi:ABC-2 type transport system ATP-binding protein